MTEDRRRFVQRYVERQKTYLPTYTNQDLVNECHPTPPRIDVGFGFDTPVLRPRASRTHNADLSNQGPREASSLSPALGKKDKSRKKRKKASTPIDTDNERAARLADRRERKRKKRAIVNPPQKDDDEIVPAPKKGRTKKPAALAFLYGFSATNVTKDRLTLKPAPSLGVFSKGRASAKKKVSATRKSSSRNELFSESAFLNKPSERAADPSKIDDDSDDSSTPIHPVPQKIRATKKDRGKCTETPASKPSQASTRTTAESEVWDIEMQSKLPSSARDVSNEPEAKGSAPVVLDLHRAKWSGSINVAEERWKKTQTPRPPVTRSRSRGRSIVRSCQLAGSDLRDELRIPHVEAADVSSLHPSHSASQVGCRVADTQASDLQLVTSKYFIEPKPVSVQGFAVNPPQTSRSNDGIDVVDSQDQDIKDVVLDIQTIHRVASPIDSLSSVPLPMVEFQTRYDMVPLEFPSDNCLHDKCWGGGLDRGYFESSVVETRDDRFIDAPEYEHAHQGETWDWYPSVGLATDDVGFQGGYDPMVREYEYEDELEEAESVVEPCFIEAEAEYDPEEGPYSERWFYMGDCPVYEGETVDGSICDSEESLDDVADFLEGRALLLGMPGHHSEGLSGLVQAEMDVASRLRDHWRPLRL